MWCGEGGFIGEVDDEGYLRDDALNPSVLKVVLGLIAVMGTKRL